MVSSANFSTVLDKPLSKSLMKMRNKIGPNTDHCRTPLHTGLHLEYLPSRHTRCCRPVSHALIQLLVTGKFRIHYYDLFLHTSGHRIIHGPINSNGTFTKDGENRDWKNQKSCWNLCIRLHLLRNNDFNPVYKLFVYEF